MSLTTLSHSSFIRGLFFRDRFELLNGVKFAIGYAGEDYIQLPETMGWGYGGRSDDIIINGVHQEGQQGNDNLYDQLGEIRQDGGDGDDIHDPGTGYTVIDAGDGRDSLLVPTPPLVNKDPQNRLELYQRWQPFLPQGWSSRHHLFKVDLSHNQLGNEFADYLKNVRISLQ